VADIIARVGHASAAAEIESGRGETNA
jgi:hypothetical protein